MKQRTVGESSRELRKISEGAMQLMAGAGVVPVLTLEDAQTAVPIARALLSGGLNVLEVTLRSADAFESIVRIAAEIPEAVVGVGSVIEGEQFARARQVGARFAVSPACTPSLIAAASDTGLPWIPGAQTTTEILSLRERGCLFIKFFPAELNGGANFLQTLARILPDTKFCPTGGITPDTAASYLKLPNVLCVGGSWLTPESLVVQRDWQSIARRAASARQIS